MNEENTNLQQPKPISSTDKNVNNFFTAVFSRGRSKHLAP